MTHTWSSWVERPGQVGADRSQLCSKCLEVIVSKTKAGISMATLPDVEGFR